MVSKLCLPDGLRLARPADIPRLCELGLEAMQQDPYPSQVISAEKIHSTVLECVSSPSSYCVVAVDEDKVIQGCVAAVTHEQMFYERKQASVVMFYCKIPGAGVKCLRAFLRWARSRPTIKSIIFTIEINADPRIGKLLGRLGLSESLPVYMETR